MGKIWAKSAGIGFRDLLTWSGMTQEWIWNNLYNKVQFRLKSKWLLSLSFRWKNGCNFILAANYTGSKLSTVSFKTLIMKVWYTSDFFVGMSFMNYQMMFWVKNEMGYVQIFEKIEFFNFPCYFPFKIFRRFRIFAFTCMTWRPLARKKYLQYDFRKKISRRI